MEKNWAGDKLMLILALDTTTSSGSAALLDKAELLAEVSSEVPFTHSARLLASINFLLKKNDLDIRSVEGFAVAAGPGSFTGIRIGLSTVKALSYASGKPIAAVSALHALAWKLKDPQGRLIAPLIDAKKGEIYAALYESRGSEFQEVVAQGAYAPDKFLSLVPSHRVVHLIGSGVQPFRKKILDYLKDKVRFSSRSLFIASEVGVIGYELLKKGRGVSFREIEPIYYRKSQAEEKK